MIREILPKYPHTIFERDLEYIEGRVDELYYCNIFYMTFEPIRRVYNSMAERFIGENHVIIKEYGSLALYVILPGFTH